VLLLDTHVWLWATEGDTRRLERRARQALARAHARDLLRISPISVFELTALHPRGRVRLARPLDQWLSEALDTPGVRVAPLTPVIAADAGTIPNTALADPMDRLLVATARHLDAVLLTADRRILDYARSIGNVRALDAGT
jgi:PIN domain nuclease of toxin-antitoxin system